MKQGAETQRKKLIRRGLSLAAVCLAVAAPTLHMTAHAHGSTGDTKSKMDASVETAPSAVDAYLQARAAK